MPKLKTHSGSKKRFKITAKGKVKAGASHRRHFMRRRTKDSKRASRRGTILMKTDGDNLVRFFLKPKA